MPTKRVPARQGVSRPDRKAANDLERTLLDCARAAGKVLLKYHGQITNPRRKGSTSSIVCDADLAAEEVILQIIQRRFPKDGFIAEESGRVEGSTGYTWVIDPLDGTSNFVAGLPWFGVQLGVLRRAQPIAAIMYLPLSKCTYLAQKGRGAFRNGKPLAVSKESHTSNVLCAFGFDPEPHRRTQKAQIELLMRVSSGVRNTRTTNSLVDFCYTADGLLGGCINLCTKIWDIVPISVILPEAGGVFSDLSGRKIEFDLTAENFGRSYAVLGSSRKLHRQFVKLTAG